MGNHTLICRSCLGKFSKCFLLFDYQHQLKDLFHRLKKTENNIDTQVARFINSTNAHRRSNEKMESASYFLKIPSEHLDFCIEFGAGTKTQIAYLIKMGFRLIFLFIVFTFDCFNLPSTLMMSACIVIVYAQYFNLIKQM